MLKFLDFLLESADGGDTAFSGHANEHFTHALVKKYVDHLSNNLRKGADYDTAHAAALKHINDIDYREHANIPEVQKGRQKMGDDELRAIHSDSKKTAIGLLNHIKNNYGHSVEDSYHTGKIGPKGIKQITGGKTSEGDILLKTKSPQGKPDTASAILDYIGSSLKYSKDKSDKIKVHSPTLHTMAKIVDDHYGLMHNESSGIHDELHDIGQEGIAAQRAVLSKHHNLLANHFTRLNDPKKTYSPIVDRHGNIVGGDLSKEATRELRKSKDPKLRAVYNDMLGENLKMKNKMAAVFHDKMSAVLDHPSKNPKQEAVKESLLRSMSNLRTDKLPTFVVSTERSKPESSIYDTGHFYTNYLAKNGTGAHNYTGKSTFKAGPLNFSIDTRPTTNRNPITSYPINTDINISDIKKAKEEENSPTTERPMQMASRLVKQKKEAAAPVVAAKEPAPAPQKKIVRQNTPRDPFTGTDSPLANWRGSANPAPSNQMFGKSFHADHELE